MFGSIFSCALCRYGMHGRAIRIGPHQPPIRFTRSVCACVRVCVCAYGCARIQEPNPTIHSLQGGRSRTSRPLQHALDLDSETRGLCCMLSLPKGFQRGGTTAREREEVGKAPIGERSSPEQERCPHSELCPHLASAEESGAEKFTLVAQIVLLAWCLRGSRRSNHCAPGFVGGGGIRGG